MASWPRADLIISVPARTVMSILVPRSFNSKAASLAPLLNGYTLTPISPICGTCWERSIRGGPFGKGPFGIWVLAKNIPPKLAEKIITKCHK